jgi:hypothetical protein
MFRQLIACHPQGALVVLAKITIKHEHSSIVMGVPAYAGKGKGGRRVRLTTLPPSCAVVMKSRNLNFLEPSGPLHACNVTAFMIINRIYEHQNLLSL